MKASDAINDGINGISNYIELELDLPTHTDGELNALGRILEDVVSSAKQFFMVEGLMNLGPKVGGQYELRRTLTKLPGYDDVFEYFAGALGLEALYRAERGATRFQNLVEILSASIPPSPARRYLASAVMCYLLNLDDACIAMCRGAVEVLAEGILRSDQGLVLGKLIDELERQRLIKPLQVSDMREINRQAREVMHDEPHKTPPSALDCLSRLSRLLAQLHPASTW